ncbi:MAG: serine hydrolase, partial [Oscillospiraceae bacterium]
YTFFESNKYGADLKELMSKTSNRMIISKFPMARKYGWTPEAFHDMAVVYADNSPYLLAILTDKSEGKKDDYKLFREISEILEKKQTEKYNAVNSEN